MRTDIANVIFQFLKFVLFECRSPDVERIDKSSIDCFAALNIFPICNPIDVSYENLNSDMQDTLVDQLTKKDTEIGD